MTARRREERGLTAQSNIIKVRRGLDGLHLAANVVLLDLVAEVGNGRVCGVIRAEDLNGLLHLIGAVHILDYGFSMSISTYKI